MIASRRRRLLTCPLAAKAAGARGATVAPALTPVATRKITAAAVGDQLEVTSIGIPSFSFCE